MNIDDIPAGREMDALVAEKVMGVQVIRLHGFDEGTMIDPDGDDIFHYSTDIAAAWEVVEKLEHDGLMLWHLGRDGSLPYWRVQFGYNLKPEAGCAEADTATLAICRAALKAACSG